MSELSASFHFIQSPLLDLASCREAWTDAWRRSSIKERMTNTGEAYNHAMQVLGDLQLADKARESGANKLGDAIRTHLQEAYGVNRIGFGNAS